MVAIFPICFQLFDYHLKNGISWAHGVSYRLWWICFHSSLCRLTPWIPWSFHGPTRRTRWLQISVDLGPTAHWMNDTNDSSAQVIFQSTAKLPQEVPGWSGCWWNYIIRLRQLETLLVTFSVAGNSSRCRRWGWGAGRMQIHERPLYLSIWWVLWGLFSFLLDFRVKMAGQKVYPPEFVASEEARLFQSFPRQTKGMKGLIRDS